MFLAGSCMQLRSIAVFVRAELELESVKRVFGELIFLDLDIERIAAYAQTLSS